MAVNAEWRMCSSTAYMPCDSQLSNMTCAIKVWREWNGHPSQMLTTLIKNTSSASVPLIPLSSHFGSNCNWSPLWSKASHTCSPLAFVSLIILSDFINVKLIDMKLWALCSWSTRLSPGLALFCAVFEITIVSREQGTKGLKKAQRRSQSCGDNRAKLLLPCIFTLPTTCISLGVTEWVSDKASRGKVPSLHSQVFAPSAHPIYTSPFPVNPTLDPPVPAPC